ncbi:MAG: UDP-glucose 4-epimerase GalE [Bacteroidota bacterium]|nr:UDP-glucose 4-epimerase GalE [Bacteroidota bacterium]
MKKIIVTGGAGYIGSHTVVELHKAGFTPIIVDNLCNSSIKNLEGIEKITGRRIKWWDIDCTNEVKMNEVFKEKDIYGIIHFAAFKSVEESVEFPEKYYRNNVESLKVLLNIMKKKNLSNLIFSSSCTVYGNPDNLPVTESSSFKKAESPYGETKQICEKMIGKVKYNSVILRYFNPIGCHSSGLIGDCSLDKPSNLVPIITKVASGKIKNITVFGNDYNTPDGTCIRDYISVVDLAKAHVLALNYCIKNGKQHIFNVGTGIGRSVLEIIRLFENANNKKVNYIIGEKRKGDIEKIYANSTLIQSKLKWKAKEDLKQVMISAWNWENTK